MSESVRIQDELVQQVLDPAEAMKRLVNTVMRPFTKEDWYGFAGCETKEPMIGEHNEFILMLDGSVLNIIHTDDMYGGSIFKLEVM